MAKDTMKGEPDSSSYQRLREGPKEFGEKKKKKVGFCKCAVSTGIHEQLYLLGTEVVAEFSRAQ